MKLLKFTSGIVVTIVAEVALVAWVLHGVQAANKKEAAKRSSGGAASGVLHCYKF